MLSDHDKADFCAIKIWVSRLGIELRNPVTPNCSEIKSDDYLILRWKVSMTTYN